jgi:hypothetical protein
MFDLFLYETHLRALRLGESLFVFSRRDAVCAEENNKKLSLRSLCLCEIKIYMTIDCMNPDSAALHPGYHVRKSAMPARNKIKNNSALSAPPRE